MKNQQAAALHTAEEAVEMTDAELQEVIALARSTNDDSDDDAAVQ